MEQRISLITLATRDMDLMSSFYDALGWQRVDGQDNVIAYDLIGQTLGLYPIEALAAEVGMDVDAKMGQAGLCSVAFSHNVRTKEEVHAVLERAGKAGAEILKEPSDVIWGGYHGYFADPEGHVWEVACNPFSKLREDGAFRWNGFE